MSGRALLGALGGYVFGAASGTLTVALVYGNNIPDWTLAPGIAWVLICAANGWAIGAWKDEPR